ncbi:hypothetical protein ACLQ2N_16260 [Streptomyces sp. DT224]|uniref:hypothetical protein n=1 Tax=Streptomyces sp. DT224 TaxID=3393426 RepID=UPI003CEE7913
MIDVLVCCNDRDRYPAVIDPADSHEWNVKPWFDLETVRRIADDSQEEAAEYGHGSVDTIHVLAGQVDGQDHAVVLNIRWMLMGGDRRQGAVEVCQPNGEGRYAIGGHGWGWYALDDDQRYVENPAQLGQPSTTSPRSNDGVSRPSST